MTTRATAKQSESKTDPFAVQVTEGVVNMRKSPDVDAKVVRLAQKGDVLIAVGESDGWTHVDGDMYVMTRMVAPC